MRDTEDLALRLELRMQSYCYLQLAIPGQTLSGRKIRQLRDTNGFRSTTRSLAGLIQHRLQQQLEETDDGN